MPKTKTIKIPPDVEAVLRQAVINGNTLKLVGQLDRDLYVRTDKVLRALGGKWNRSAKVHIFPSDPGAAIGMPGCVASADPFGDLSKALDDGKLAVSDHQLFATQPGLAQRMIEEAGIEPGHRVLEPSAGTGALLDAILATGITFKPGDIQAVEINPELSKALWRYPVDVSNGDFLSWEPATAPFPDLFDRVVLNPPFAAGQDIKHVTHALKFLKPGGRLVAIMSSGVTFRQDKAAQAFRDLVEERGGTIEALPADTFKDAGTGVSTVLVIIDA